MSKTKFEQAVDQAIEKYITTDRVVTSFQESEESGFKAGATFGSEYERERSAKLLKALNNLFTPSDNPMGHLNEAFNMAQQAIKQYEGEG